MPIYEYHCAQCGHTSEHLQKINDPAPVHCPHCHAKDSLSRQVSLTHFALKGSGWYVTDFRDKDKPSTAQNKETQEASPGQTDKKPTDTTDTTAKTSHPNTEGAAPTKAGSTSETQPSSASKATRTKADD